ncbi:MULTISPECIES: hypothetical protein, partial [Tsukamurella]|uniref:hypothetical protein n=1 Tax=Tsukamurella TaxID=2060 RepID=UPI0019622646
PCVVVHPLLGTVPPPNYDLVTDMSTTASLLVNPLPSLSAGDKPRTPDIRLAKAALYQLS